MAPVTITFRPTKGDQIRSGYLALLSRPLILALWAGFFVGVPWISALRFLADPYASRSDIVTLLAAPFVAVFFFSLIPLIVSGRARRLDGDYTYTFSEDGIHVAGPGSESRLDWTIVTRGYGYGLGVLLVSGKRPILVVPGRLLSPAVRSQLRRMIAARGIELAGAWKRSKAVEG